MSLRDDLAGVLARDPATRSRPTRSSSKPSNTPRPEEAVAGAAEARTRPRPGRVMSLPASCARLPRPGPAPLWPAGHDVLNQWGIRSTSDLGEIVFNLIASGDLEKTASDSRADFDDVFDFEAALRRDYVVPADSEA